MSVPAVQHRPGTGPAKRSDLGPEARAALEPLRAALLTQARSEAAQIRARAEDDAIAMLGEARAELAEGLVAARAQGEAGARALLRLEHGRVQQRNRGIVLAAQRQVYDELVGRAEAAVRLLLTDPVVRERLSVSLTDRLGATAVIEDTADGGLRARTPEGCLVDGSVAALVRDAVTRLDLEDLWAAVG